MTTPGVDTSSQPPGPGSTVWHGVRHARRNDRRDLSARQQRRLRRILSIPIQRLIADGWRAARDEQRKETAPAVAASRSFWCSMRKFRTGREPDQGRFPGHFTPVPCKNGRSRNDRRKEQSDERRAAKRR